MRPPMLFCMNSSRLLPGRHSSIGQSYILTTNVLGRAALFANDAVAVTAMQAFQRLDLEGLTHESLFRHAMHVMANPIRAGR